MTSQEPRPGLHVPWSALTIGLTAIAITSLGTLIVVASVQKADALSTVALALAVLAFAAQLIVSLAQASAGALQIAQAERINADTQSALAELRATSHSQLANQKDIFAQVLHAALPAVAQEISEEASKSNETHTRLDPLSIEEHLTAAVERVLTTLPTSSIGNASSPSLPSTNSTRPMLPSEKKQASIDFESLTPQQSIEFRRIVGMFRAAKTGFDGSITAAFPETMHRIGPELAEADIIDYLFARPASGASGVLCSVKLTAKGIRLAEYISTMSIKQLHKLLAQKEKEHVTREQSNAAERVD